MNLKERATLVAKTFKVKVERDHAVLITEAYKKAHPYDWENALGHISRIRFRFEDTPYYKELVKLGLFESKEISKAEVYDLFFIAKRRFWRAVCGNLNVYSLDNEENSDFLKIDLPLILESQSIRRINGENKFDFAKKCGF